ncbi:hypothetical protein [Demequina aestuarii]|uniref:hypothetical protein n=1 Tax=Demequina aestuarii TaxID=327095 RepID=UPI000783250F|nr:hypothetical protein [Demequina aestuarii]
MTRIVILSALELRRSTALQSYIDRFREHPGVEVDVITLGPLSHWRETDPEPLVLDPRIGQRRKGRNPWHKAKVARLTLRGPRWRMARLLARSTEAQAMLDQADFVYVDQSAAVLAAWQQARRHRAGQYFTSVPRIERLLTEPR